jgi:glycosyltransferase involved in cell wall biosynthesis
MPEPASAISSRGKPERGGILVYGMYPLTGRQDRAPEVRIAAMTAALGARTHTEQILGGRFGRFGAALRWLAGGGPRRVGAVYVESSTASAMPTDLLFLALLRLYRRRVGVYFRDAYQLYRGLYPRTRRRQVITDWLWRLTTPILARLATERFAASMSLAEAIKLRDPIALGPGADPSLPDLGAGADPIVAYVGSAAWADGFDLLLDAMEIVRARLPEARLLIVSSSVPADSRAISSVHVDVRPTGRGGLADQLRSARVCVIPRPITAYSDLAIPIKLWDYLSMGKPVVATAAGETQAILVASEAGITTPDTPEGLAEGLLRPLLDIELARRLAANARSFACSSEQTWDARARTVLRSLGLEESPAPEA